MINIHHKIFETLYKNIHINRCNNKFEIATPIVGLDQFFSVIF